MFFGSSDFSLPAFEYCLTFPHQVIAIVTTPDQPKGRGLLVQPNVVRVRAEEAQIPVYAPHSLKEDSGLREKIAALGPDLFLVASYGKLIPSFWLSIPKTAALNIHPSLLPKYRGAAPIPWQIVEGEKETGLTIFLVTEALDAGDIVYQVRIPLGDRETTESLSYTLSHLAPKGLQEVFLKLEKGNLVGIPQKESEASYARKLIKEDGYLRLEEPAVQLERKIRAFHPWPGAFIACGGKPLRILEAAVDSATCVESRPGTVLEIHSQGSLRIQTGKGSLKILRVQLPGRNPISGSDLANGLRLKPGFVFENFKNLEKTGR